MPGPTSPANSSARGAQLPHACQSAVLCCAMPCYAALSCAGCTGTFVAHVAHSRVLKKERTKDALRRGLRKRVGRDGQGHAPSRYQWLGSRLPLAPPPHNGKCHMPRCACCAVLCPGRLGQATSPRLSPHHLAADTHPSHPPSHQPRAGYVAWGSPPPAGTPGYPTTAPLRQHPEAARDGAAAAAAGRPVTNQRVHVACCLQPH